MPIDVLKSKHLCLSELSDICIGAPTREATARYTGRPHLNLNDRRPVFISTPKHLCDS